VILDNKSYDLDVSDGLKDLPAVIAAKVTLMTANKLNLSVENLPPSWGNYDFYSKIKEAQAIVAPRELKKNLTICQLILSNTNTYLGFWFILLGIIEPC